MRKDFQYVGKFAHKYKFFDTNIFFLQMYYYVGFLFNSFSLGKYRYYIKRNPIDDRRQTLSAATTSLKLATSLIFIFN